MKMYFEISKRSIVRGPIPRDQIRHKTTSVGTGTTDAELKVLGFLPQVKVGEELPVNDNTEVKTGPVHIVGADEVISTWTVRTRTTQEQTDYDQDVDRRAILNGVLDLAEIFFSVVDVHLKKGTLAASEFPVAIRQKYVALRASVDRLKS